VKWETRAAVFAGVTGLLGGCGVIPSGIGFAVVFLAVGTWAIWARRRERAQRTTGGAASSVNTQTYPTVIGHVEVRRPLARVLGALFLGAGIGLIGHIIGLW
jgi:hypothetical protein